MNENEIARIAAAANAMRPDWPLPSIVTLLNRPELVNRPRRDVAVALSWVACESVTKTPARILEVGPWWQATNAEKSPEDVRRPPRKAEECRTHPGEYAASCRCCAADKRAVTEEPADTEATRRSTQEAIRAAREEVRKATTAPEESA